ncbi:MAG: hypothetical protein JO257_35080 [Deltaproteobacteria bacterium]|nr:hypothetical protein [Deltaproteobacteria bacterium]
MAVDDVTDPQALLDRARTNYERECARPVGNDPAERQEAARRYRDARAEYFRLLGEHRR